jgi:putative ABC transport system permease protein
METFWQDVRYGVRMLTRTPALTAIIVVTLGLGIGANTAIFGVVNALVLRPMAAPNPDELTVLAISHPGNEEPHGISYPDFQDYRKESSAFSEFAAFDLGFVGVTHGERSERMIVSYVAGDFFKMLGVKPLLGRLILPTEGLSPGADPVIVLGYDCWKRKFNGDLGVIGQSIRVEGHAVTIIGVVPASFTGAYSIVLMDAYLPMGMNSYTPDNAEVFTKRDNHSLHVLARLKPRATLKQAQASLAVIAEHLAAQYPDTDKGNKIYVLPEHLARPEPNSAQQNPLVAGIFLILVGLVLLVACVNVTNILLARAAAREKELAIRAAMGAGHGRLVRQMLTESGMLAVLGGATGMLFGWWASLGLERIQIPGGIPFRIDLSFDWRSFGYVAAVALASGILVGLVPALRASRSDLNQTLREGGRGMGGGIERHRVRNVLVISQVAGSMILLIAGGLFIRSLGSAQTADLGFHTDHLISFSVDPAQINFDRARSEQFYRELEGRVRVIPGVMSASFAFSTPMGYFSLGGRVMAEGQTLAPGEIHGERHGKITAGGRHQ